MSNVLARGQLAASNGTILAASNSVNPGLYNLLLVNTSASLTETVTITNVGSDGVTSTLLPAITLAPKSTYTLTGIPTAAGDILKGYTTDATTVDYQITSIQGAFGINSFNASGAVNQVNSGVTGGQTIAGGQTVSGRLTAQLLATGPAPTDTYAATMTIDVTYSLHVIAGVSGTSATVTLTPSAAGTAGDELVIITTADGSGTVTATFASTFHSAGTQATTLSKYSTITFVSTGTVWLEKSRITALT